MTDRELRLRQRIDQLRKQRDRLSATLEARDEAAQKRRETTVTQADTQARAEAAKGCVYCGTGPSTGRPKTCIAHRDLPALDPHYIASAPPANTRSKTPANHPHMRTTSRMPQPLRNREPVGTVAA